MENFLTAARLHIHAKRFMDAYSAAMQPLSREFAIPQTAAEILLFLANNPDYSTAGDIVNVRKIKANLVSVNVEKLAKDGYIERTNIEGDRRKIRLSLTEKAQPIVERGRQLQQSFFDMLFENTTDEMKKNFTETVGIIDRNLDEMLKG